MADPTVAESVAKSLNQLNASISASLQSLENLNKKALEGGLGFNTIIRASTTTANAVRQAGQSIAGLGDAMTLGLDKGAIEKVYNFLADKLTNISGIGIEALTLFNNFGRAMDVVTQYTRELNSKMYALSTSFGLGYSNAKKYSDYIITSAQKFASAQFGFIAPSDRIQVAQTMEDVGLSLEHMSDMIVSSAGTMDLLNTAFLHSKSLGMDLNTYFKYLSDGILKQGLSSQEAAEQIAMYGDISAKTGLKVSSVASSLSELANGFSDIGVNATFGRPALEGFTNTLKDMGLGIGNAIELSQELSKSLIGIASNYSAAYLTFQRGGLNIGGGANQGALGAGIQLRARLLEGGDQSQLAKDLAMGMRNTLASVGGGDIATLREAAADPRMINAYVTQTSLLKDIYNIQDQDTADRTLDLLEQLNKATAEGDTSLMDSLGSDIQDIIGARQDTLSFDERTAVASEASYAELQKLSGNIIEGMKQSAASLAEYIYNKQREGLDVARSEIPGIPEMSINFNQMGEVIEENLAGIISRYGSDFTSLYNTATTTMSDIFEDISDSTNNSDLMTAIKSLLTRIDNLVTALDGINLSNLTTTNSR